ncbi:hypothetical protein BDV32DRAFT_116202 [Aspergillus pseudonomiae]|nr:hypothetical protein BDV32DRAFT_116202 [Aspergillus pseudonomiae]
MFITIHCLSYIIDLVTVFLLHGGVDLECSWFTLFFFGLVNVHFYFHSWSCTFGSFLVGYGIQCCVRGIGVGES